jgi:hypothetical protein
MPSTPFTPPTVQPTAPPPIPARLGHEGTSLAPAVVIAAGAAFGLESLSNSMRWPRAAQGPHQAGRIAAIWRGVGKRLIAPAYVKPFVKRQKNDAAERPSSAGVRLSDHRS